MDQQQNNENNNKIASVVQSKPIIGELAEFQSLFKLKVI